MDTVYLLYQQVYNGLTKPYYVLVGVFTTEQLAIEASLTLDLSIPHSNARITPVKLNEVISNV